MEERTSLDDQQNHKNASTKGRSEYGNVAEVWLK